MNLVNVTQDKSREREWKADMRLGGLSDGRFQLASLWSLVAPCLAWTYSAVANKAILRWGESFFQIITNSQALRTSLWGCFFQHQGIVSYKQHWARSNGSQALSQNSHFWLYNAMQISSALLAPIALSKSRTASLNLSSYVLKKQFLVLQSKRSLRAYFDALFIF